MNILFQQAALCQKQNCLTQGVHLISCQALSAKINPPASRNPFPSYPLSLTSFLPKFADHYARLAHNSSMINIAAIPQEPAVSLCIFASTACPAASRLPVLGNPLPAVAGCPCSLKGQQACRETKIAYIFFV
jgi:hypothetical protein